MRRSEESEESGEGQHRENALVACTVGRLDQGAMVHWYRGRSTEISVKQLRCVAYVVLHVVLAYV